MAAVSIVLIPAESTAGEVRPKRGQTVGDEAVAIIGQVTVSAAQLEEVAGDRLTRLKSEEYAIKRQVLEDLITRTLLEREAAARGVSVDELTRREIESKVTVVTEDQTRAVYESNPSAYQGKSEPEALAQIGTNLRRLRTTEARRKFLTALKEKAGVKILLEPPRVAISTADDPSLGPTGAQVTVVEFSDFECPYCARVAPSLKALRERYGDRIRVVFRDYPLPMHKHAIAAAEAAQCAHQQGKFWEMHDRLFANQRSLEPADFNRYATELGLDLQRFAECLASERRAAAWQRDVADASRYGVSVTPTFFINGRLLTGAQPYQSLVNVIDEELGWRAQGLEQNTPTAIRRNPPSHEFR
jgi:protein-disulfide isomerase